MAHSKLYNVSHSILHKVIAKRKRVYGLTQNIAVLAVIDDLLSEVEQIFMKELEKEQANEKSDVCITNNVFDRVLNSGPDS